MDSLEDHLIQAIIENNFQRLENCLLKGANPNKIANCGKTPLGVSAQFGNFNIFKALAENHINSILCKSNTNRNYREPQSAFDTTDNVTNRNIGYFVVCKDLDENEFGEDTTPDGMEALEWDTEITDENFEDENLCPTPPEARIYKWYADVLNKTAITLKSPDNDITRVDRYGHNVLHYAIKHGHCIIVEYLLDGFNEISVNQNDGIFAPLHFAILQGDLKMVKLLLDKGANVNFVNRERRTPLHIAAQNGYLDIINLLIENGANLNVYDIGDYSPLTLSILYDHEEAAKILINKGSRLNYEESCGYTVLYRAVWSNLTETTRALLEAGAKIIQSHYLLDAAIRHNNFEMIRILHKFGALLNIRNEQGQTPLMLSCMYQNIQVAKYLLKNGALANARNEQTGLTALHICVDCIRDETMFKSFLELLLSYDADINAISFMGNVLFYAITVANIDAACMLVKYGADVNSREERYFVDFLILAKKHGNADLVKLIIYSGYNFYNNLFDIKHLKSHGNDSLYDFILTMVTKPLNLKDLCRIKIRHSLAKNLNKKIYQLPLPNILMRYLTFEEL